MLQEGRVTLSSDPSSLASFPILWIPQPIKPRSSANVRLMASAKGRRIWETAGARGHVGVSPPC